MNTDDSYKESEQKEKLNTMCSNKKDKSTTISIIKNSFLLVTMVLSASLVLSSCATRMKFSNSPVVPAAEGSVKIKKDNNNNYKIELKLIRLAEPNRLTQPKSKYVVWMVTENDGTKNIGQLKTATGLFSNSLKSALNTVTSSKPRDFFVTAEDDGDVQIAGYQIVMKTSSF
jgi:hypothetical protein